MHFSALTVSLVGWPAFAQAASVNAAIWSMPWNERETFGPDGPWQALELTVGASNISVYPSSSLTSTIIEKHICPQGADKCAPELTRPGLYDLSTTSARLLEGNTSQLTSGTALVADDFSVSAVQDGAARRLTAPGVPFTMITNETFLPGAGATRQSLGTLGLGLGSAEGATLAPNRRPTFSYALPDSAGTAPSWGLHVGSARYGISGQLLHGGYDRNRLAGNIFLGVWHGNDTQPVAALRGVQLDTGAGPASWNKTVTPNILDTGGNASVASLLDPGRPYLYLPGTTCQALADALPLRFEPTLNLYAWNTEDPAYERLVSGGAHLQFQFAASNATIRVPLGLLNLTLAPPVVPRPQAYFPCQQTPLQGGGAALGRAFLQAAYLFTYAQGFILAQGPGPSFNRTPEIAMLAPGSSIAPGPEAAWAASWKDVWRPEDAAATPGGPAGSSSSGGGALPTATIAGAAVGAVAGITLLAALVAFSLRRRRQRQRARAASPRSPASDFATDDDEKAGPRRAELAWRPGPSRRATRLHELPSPEPHELASPDVDAEKGAAWAAAACSLRAVAVASVAATAAASPVEASSPRSGVWSLRSGPGGPGSVASAGGRAVSPAEIAKRSIIEIAARSLVQVEEVAAAQEEAAQGEIGRAVSQYGEAERERMGRDPRSPA